MANRACPYQANDGVQHHHRQPADQRERRLDRGEGGGGAVAQPFGEQRAEAHREDHHREHDGRLGDRVADQVRGERDEFEFVDQAAGGADEDGGEDERAGRPRRDGQGQRQRSGGGRAAALVEHACTLCQGFATEGPPKVCIRRLGTGVRKAGEAAAAEPAPPSSARRAGPRPGGRTGGRSGRSGRPGRLDGACGTGTAGSRAPPARFTRSRSAGSGSSRAAPPAGTRARCASAGCPARTARASR